MEYARLFLITLILCTTSATAQSFRLPETISPSRYIVDLYVPEKVFTGENNTFEGSSTVIFTVNSSTSEINIHHRTTIRTTVLSLYGAEIAITSNNYNATTEILTMTTAYALQVGVTYQLNFTHYSIFEDAEMQGFYTSTYKDENNATAWLVTTQFQPTHARHAFPCFDEPQYKAVFDISLTYPRTFNALANTNVDRNEEVADSTYIKTYFKQTTKMSTYLIAFIISKFTCTEADTIDGSVVHQVCSRDEEKADRTWAVEVGTPLLRTLESMFGIKYGSYMPKMDQVAIPDFSAGAMENWGLVTYRETGLLFSEENTSNSYRKSIALVIAHEFTHMWFGNLITCKWWDYTFLNEGFARYFQYFAAAATSRFLDWELEKHFVVEQVHTGLLADSTTSADALTSTAASQSQISGKFTTISYNKGACIFRMIELNILGSDNFIYSLRDYLSTYTSQGTIPANLWSSMSKFVPSQSLPSGTNLTAVLHNWVEESGHPVVYVTKRDNDVVLTQERFLLSGNQSRTYYVPITYTVSDDVTTFSNTTIKTWLIPEQSTTLSNVLNNSDWIILNNRQSGFYRVNYDDTLWSAIKNQLHSNHLVIDVLNRAQLISDAYNFARSSKTEGYGSWTYKELMSLLSYLEHEVDYYPWYAAIVGNNHLLLRIGSDSVEGQQFISWMLKLMQKVYKTVPFDVIDNSNQVYSMKQALILQRACRYGESSCVAKSKELFANYKTNGVRVPKNLRVTVYCTAMWHSTDAVSDFNFLWSKFQETKLMSEILTILSGLGCTQDATTLKSYLGQTINSTAGIRIQDFTSVWSYVYSSSRAGTNAALEFIAENYAALVAYRSGSVGRLISGAASYIHNEDQLAQLENLINLSGISAEHKAAAESSLNSAKSSIEAASTWKADVRTYLASEPSSASTISIFSILFVCVVFCVQIMFVWECNSY